MGTQIHAGDNYRRVVELVQAGAIGPVRDVHVWLGANFDGPPKPVSRRQSDAPKVGQPVPKTLDWDLWLGPAPFRPYSGTYVPFQWRYWWAFGNGILGDFFCHFCDLAFWALKLRHPTTIEAEGPVHPESTAHWTIAREEFPARGDLPPAALTWYHGGAHPDWVKEKKIPQWGNAVLFVGADGMLIADYGRHQLLPEEKFKDYQRPAKTIPDSIGHHAEWIKACKTGSPTTCNFDYSGALTEAALLCNVALRTGKKLAVGCGQSQGDQLPRGRPLPAAGLPAGLDVVKTILRGELLDLQQFHQEVERCTAGNRCLARRGRRSPAPQGLPIRSCRLRPPIASPRSSL